MKSTMKMRTRILSVILSLCMIVTFLPGEAFAASGTTTSGKLIISDKSYEIAPDIVEREYITNNGNLTAQQMGHVMEVKLGGNAQIIAGYNDYNIESIKSNKNWGMKRTTEQAEAAENRRGVNVVGAVNGDFFNMSNGQPTGALIMNGTVIQNTNRPCFYIDKDNVPHITANSADLPEGVKEAIGGAVVLVADGQPTGVSDSTTNPRTAVGIKADNTVVIYMVDGRQAPLSIGMSYDELTQTMMDLGCVWALNLDGGGSSTFATQRAGDPDNNTAGLTLRCSPSDGYERTVSSSLLVVSSADSDGVFDHAVVSPNQEIYTPGSAVTFTAQGADKSGGAAELPGSGLSWTILSGSHLGTIDGATGVFTGAEGKTGTVTVGLTYNGETVGQTSVELQWPDQLGFTNSSVSLDFGESSDLTFKAYWNNQEVNYKEGDFNWTLSDDALGSFNGNIFVATNTKSMKGSVTATSAGNSSVFATVDVVVGLEPYVLMDFENHVKEDKTVIAAKDYWKIYVGASADPQNGQGMLTPDEVAANRLWIRDTTNKGVIQSGRLVNIDDGEPVRFGENALRLDYDFRKVNSTTTAVNDFGFAADTQISIVQPTKIGMWIYIPADCKDPSQLKAVIKGNSFTTGDNTAYRTYDQDYNETIQNGGLNGTTKYVTYYSYDENGNVTGSCMADWAGKGWTWIECDISTVQMPVDICRSYTLRITSAQNVEKQAGHIYVDNVQLIYGTNPNDIVKPTVDSIQGQEGNNAKVEIKDGETKFSSSLLNFVAQFSDDTGKYATGIDPSTVRIYIDGMNYTQDKKVEYVKESNTIYLNELELTNGQHSIKIVVRDRYGNETAETRYFTVEDADGKEAAVAVVPQEESPVIGGTFTLYVVNVGDQSVDEVTVTIEVPEAYAKLIRNKLADRIKYGANYEQFALPKYENGKITIHAKKKGSLLKKAAAAIGLSDGSEIASISFDVPEDAKEGETFPFSVPEANYSIGDKTETFSMPSQETELDAEYTVSASKAIVNLPVTFKVTDKEGKEVDNVTLYSDGQEITNPYTYTTGGRKTIYAKDTNGKRSWNFDIVVNVPGSEGEGAPFGIQNNASKDGATMRQISWLSAMGMSKEEAFIRYGESKEAVEAAEPIKGVSEVFTFVQTNSGDAYRLNKVSLEGLAPATTYYYQVGDGEKWSEVRSFITTPAEKNAKTNFFIFGDIQSQDTANLSVAVRNITGSDLNYNFGIQTGDAIDDVTVFGNWSNYLTTLNSGTLEGIDMIHTLGNHEYYGDSKGLIAGGIFGLPETERGSYYSVEYGSVYVGVVNNGGDLVAALEEAKADAEKSDCAWKTLVVHEPIYGTTEEMDAESRAKVTKIIEEGGFDFVFTGDDHAYARTYPMLGDVAQAEDSQEGVVYYICGDLSSKSNDFTKYNYFAEAIPHVNYTGMYMSVEADGEKIVLNAYDYNGNLLDSYTKTKTDCELGNHTFDENTLYDLATKTLQCKLCGEDVPAAESKYTGKLATKGGEGEVILAGGTVKTGWFTWVEDICHAGDDGLLHKTTTKDTATCTEDGHIVATCEDCNKTYTGAYTYGKGHIWDADHVCTVCGTVGISMDEVTLKLNGKYWEYRGSGIRAAVDATYGNYKLTASSDRYGRDAFISYSNNINVGMGTVTFDGRGDFYGTKSIEFPIVPKSVTEITAGEVLSTKAIIRWDEAPGAGYYRVYKKTAETGWELVGKTTDSSIIVSDLQPETEYTFRVGSSTDVAGETFNGLYWSNELSVTTKTKSDQNTEDNVTGIRAVIDVNGAMVEIPMVKKDDMNYMLLPSGADLNALQLDLTMTDNSQDVTYIGTAGEQTENGNQPTINVGMLSGKQKGTHQIMLTLPGCEPMSLSIMKSENIPAMYLTSDDPIGQGRDFVDASKSNAVTAQMTMVGPNGNLIYSGSLTQLKARGNSTFTYYDKKSYQIKLTDKTDLVGSGENVKTWVLLAGYGDATQLHDKLVKDLASDLGMPYVASCDWVDLYYDGEYRGTYLLSEKNGVSDSSVNITDMEDAYAERNEGYGENMQTATGTNAYGQEYQYTTGLTEPEDITGGYFIERNLNTIDEASGFYTRQGCGFNVKSPEFAGEEAMKYISEYYQEFEDAVFAQDEEGNYTGLNPETGKYYYEYCDKDSLVKVFLLQELAFNADGFLSSCYFYKDAGDIMYAGPVWDQEMTFGTSWSRNNSPDGDGRYYLAQALYQIPDFKEAVDEYYASEFADQVKGLIRESGIIAGYKDKISASKAMNYVLWPYVRIGSPSASGHLWAAGTTYGDVITDMIQWITERLVKLNELYGDGNEHVEHTYISQVTKEPTYEEEGIRTYTCTVCGETYTEAIPKLTKPSSGGGGGIALPPVAEDNVTNQGTTNTDNAVTNAEITPTTTTSGAVDAVVDQTTADKIVDKAAAHNSVEIVIDAAGGKDDVNTATVTIPTKTIEQLVEKTNAKVTVKTDAGEMTFDKKAVSAIAGQTEGAELKIIVEKTKDEAVEMNFELKVVSGNTVIGDFHGGKVKVTVKLNKALNEKKVTCVYKDNDGFISKVGGKKNENGTYTFTTTHFSTYIIMAEEEAEQLIADQAADIQKTKIGLRSSLVTLKGGKKAVKIVWYAKDGSKLNLDGVEIFRSVKKKSGYGVKPIFTTTKKAYYNTAIKVGTRYYYKVRGYKMVGDKKVYTDWSSKAWRIVK